MSLRQWRAYYHPDLPAEALLTLVRPLVLTGGLLAATLAPVSQLDAAEGGAPQGPRISAVVIEGATRTHPDRIRTRLGTRVGDTLDRDALAADVREIHEMKAFTGIRSEIVPDGIGGVRVVFHLTELPYVGEIRFEGVTWFVRRNLDQKIRTIRGSYLNPLTVERDRRALEDHFRSENYLYASVRAETVVDQNTGIGTLVFHIDRGSQVEVARVLFANLPDSVVAYFLRQQLANKPGEPYEAEMVKWDAGTVAQWVRDRGYLDGVVATSRVEFFDKVETWEDRSRHGPRLIPEGKRDDRVVVTHFIEPGKRYRLGSVRFVHNAEVVSEEELRSAFGLKDGVLYQRRVIELAIERCRYLLANQGYARASVVQDAVRDPETGTVDLTLRVVEGTIYTVGRIDPDGNTITKDRIVRRSMNLDPGDLYNETAVENSKEQLRRTGIFKDDPQFPLKIEKYYPDDRPDEVDLRVKLAEEDTGSFSVTAGWSSSSGFSVGLRYTEKNFDLIGAVWDRENWRGAGQILNASANLDSDNTSLSLSWTEPRVMDGPYFLSLAFARNETTALDWDEVRVTWSATVGRYFFNYALLLQAQYSYTDLVTKNGQLDAANDTWIRVPANYHMNTVTLTQTWDKRNRANLTTSGYRITLQESITGGLLSASHPYLELSANIEGWIPLFESDLGGTTFLYLRQKFGYARGLTGENYVPFYDRFYGGGPFPRHRGWEQNEQGPREENNFGLQSRPGGTREWLTTIQINVPVDGTQQGIRAVAFADIGNIWGPDEGFSLSQLVVAAGVGLRLPVALPIAFDFAWVLNPEEGQPGSQFHFGITGGF